MQLLAQQLCLGCTRSSSDLTHPRLNSDHPPSAKQEHSPPCISVNGNSSFQLFRPHILTPLILSHPTIQWQILWLHLQNRSRTPLFLTVPLSPCHPDLIVSPGPMGEPCPGPLLGMSALFQELGIGGLCKHKVFPVLRTLQRLCIGLKAEAKTPMMQPSSYSYNMTNSVWVAGGGETLNGLLLTLLPIPSPSSLCLQPPSSHTHPLLTLHVQLSPR